VRAALLALRRRARAVRAHVDNWTLAVVCAVAVPAFVVLFFRAGKATMLPPAPGVVAEDFGCCSQGLVYPRAALPGLLRFLAGRADGQIDLLINDYARDEGLGRYALYPVQLQHVGPSGLAPAGAGPVLLTVAQARARRAAPSARRPRPCGAWRSRRARPTPFGNAIWSWSRRCTVRPACLLPREDRAVSSGHVQGWGGAGGRRSLARWRLMMDIGLYQTGQLYPWSMGNSSNLYIYNEPSRPAHLSILMTNCHLYRGCGHLDAYGHGRCRPALARSSQEG
jgi:hypothetical protein